MNRLLNRLVVSALFSSALLFTISSQAQNAAPVFMLDGQSVEVPYEIIQDGEVTTWDYTGNLEIGGTDGAVLTGLNMSADPDPLLGYAIGVVDIGAPSVFGFSFGTPIVPTSPPGMVSTGFSASLTDGGDGAISITPVAPGVPVDGDGVTEIQVATDGFPLANDGHDLAPAAAFTGPLGSAFVHGPFNESGPMPGPGPWTWLQLDVNFMGSGGNDFYGLTGSVLKIEGIPEPGSTLLLALVGLSGCAMSRRLRLFTR